ncbi:urease accessory protein UreD [Vibrio sp. SS-MA-C1-2]|nr:urease accessory protein UreD [Vibrio sp. SS-MA-C1-2]UJF17823.1 urease accessory protein UreD [Vibrio sp. SS-MA-C1-2]
MSQQMEALSKPTSASINHSIEQDTRKGWKADLQLSFTDRGDKTVLKHRSQSGPLAIQRPLYPDGKKCHIYLLHPPGGVVGGDSLNINITIDENAEVLVTTPGATKFYRSQQRYAKQKQTIYVKKGAQLEWFPQENIFFPDAHSYLETDIILEKDALFWGWEMHCFGRPAQNECFNAGQIYGRTKIVIEKETVLTESLSFTGGDNSMIKNGLLNKPMSASLYFTSKDQGDLELVQDLLNQVKILFMKQKNLSLKEMNRTMILGVTQIDKLIVIRALAEWSEDILMAFTHIWQHVKQAHTEERPEIPRIWLT